jgi:hypothetical protein
MKTNVVVIMIVTSFLELVQHLFDGLLRGKHDHDLKLLHLDVNGVIVLDEEHSHLVCEDVWALLHNQIDVSQCNVLNLGLLGCQKCHWVVSMFFTGAQVVVVPRGGAIFLQRVRTTSALVIDSMYSMSTLTAANTTAELL